MEEARRLSIVAPNNMAAPSITLFKLSIISCVPQTTPPTVSLEPLMNLVKLCITISAPSSFGDIDSGEKVLSTTSFKLYFLASLAKPGISATSSNGLLTDSQ